MRRHTQDDNVSKPAYDSHPEETDENEEDYYEDDEFEREIATESQDVTPIGHKDVINITKTVVDLHPTAISARGGAQSNNLMSTRSQQNLPAHK